MKKVVITGKNQAKIAEVPDPKATDNWALVKVMVSPMCTEYKDYTKGVHDPFLGHEAAGEVVEIPRSDRIKKGDRVVVMPMYPCGKCPYCLRGEYIHCLNNYDVKDFTGSSEGISTYAQFLVKPDWLLPKIPEGMSYEHASMLCCGLGPTFGAMERMNVNAFDTVLITGLGPVGLGGIINGIYRGARIIAVGHNDYRRKLAKKLGANMVLDSKNEDVLERIKTETEGVGVDKAVDCAGTEEAQRFCVDATRRNGSIAFVGESGNLQVNISDDMIRKGLTLYGVWHYNLNDIPKVFRIADTYGHLLDKMITHTFPLDNVEEAWRLQLKRETGKVILRPWE